MGLDLLQQQPQAELSDLFISSFVGVLSVCLSPEKVLALNSFVLSNQNQRVFFRF